MTIGLVQMKPVFGKKRHNIERAVHLMEEKKADLYVLPELFNTGYSFRDRREVRSMAEPAEDGETSRALAEHAGRAKASIVCGIAEVHGAKLYNTALLITSDGKVRTYRKTHLFMFEKRLFDAGYEPYKVYRAGGVRLGMLICFDWIFPEPFRELALGGAEIVAHPSNLILPYCQDAMVTRALENRIFIAVANRTGTERRRGDTLRFTGGSEIVSPRGKVLAKAPMDRELILTARLDPAEARDKKVTPLNHVFNDRRVDLYRRMRKGRRR